MIFCGDTSGFALHIASTHLAAIRFYMLVFAKQTDSGLQMSIVKDKLVKGLMSLNFSKQQWLLRALIYKGQSGIKRQLGCSVEQIMKVMRLYE